MSLVQAAIWSLAPVALAQASRMAWTWLSCASAKAGVATSSINAANGKRKRDRLQRPPFPPCGGRQRRLGEHSEPSRNRKGGRALQARIAGGDIGRRFSPAIPSAASPPFPTFPRKGGRSAACWVKG